MYFVAFLDDRYRCVQSSRTQGVLKDSGSSQCEQRPLERNSRTDPFMTAAVVCLFAADLLVFDSKRSVSSIISSPMISSIISGYGKVSEEVTERLKDNDLQE